MLKINKRMNDEFLLNEKFENMTWTYPVARSGSLYSFQPSQG